MKIHIYYGGRGVVDDPTIFVLDRMQAVLEELNVSVERFNLYEIKNAITTLPQTLKAADGIILATTVEWHGIGGFMSSFLDAIWLYGDKEKISQIYMSPIVMSTTYGEREAKLDEERPIIAGVINNRLEQGMMLQMCPTVLYPITAGLYDKLEVTYEDLEVESPYNTYKNTGLPVGPICNPGAVSMNAVLYPEEHNYLYYHVDDEEIGNHIFTETYEEHVGTQ